MIKDMKELQALLKLCRKQGVTEIILGGVSVKFGEMPVRKGGGEADDDEPPTDELTPEQLMFFSAGGEMPG